MDRPSERTQEPIRQAAASATTTTVTMPVPVGVTRSQVESSYRRYAPVYDLLFGAALGPGRRAMAQMVDRLAPRHILEVGVGTGLSLAHYPAGSRITGIDLSDEMLATARRRVPSHHGHFDCVTLPYVLSVTPNPERLVAEVRRVCRPGGDIVIVNHFSGQPPWRWVETMLRPLAGWLGFRSEFSLDEHVLRHAWQVQSVAPTNLLSLSRLIHIRNVDP
jgi:phosphatidylethanolamine/phosphatidyl-N-methylethanolamine N-methyltransferase